MVARVAPEEEKYLTEIERLLKKKVDVRTLDGFDRAAQGASAVSTPREPREPRAVREPRAPRAVREPREQQQEEPRVARERTATPAPSRRDQEREEAYARNPDQPLPVRQHPARAAKAQPVPALLMKRKAPEPA